MTKTKRYIYARNNGNKEWHVEEVDAIETIFIPSQGYELSPILFIHKAGNEFMLSEEFTGSRVFTSKRKKDIHAFLKDDKNITRILEALNSERSKKIIADFTKAKSDYYMEQSVYWMHGHKPNVCEIG